MQNNVAIKQNGDTHSLAGFHDHINFKSNAERMWTRPCVCALHFTAVKKIRMNFQFTFSMDLLTLKNVS